MIGCGCSVAARHASGVVADDLVRVLALGQAHDVHVRQAALVLAALDLAR